MLRKVRVNGANANANLLCVLAAGCIHSRRREHRHSSEAPAARIVNVSSGIGSLTRNSDPAFPYRQIFGPVYPASKTALNAVTLATAIELESSGIKVNAACPGFTKTNLNNYSGTQQSRKAPASQCDWRC
jgi:NAD(P)-dependent dehydrogenase (short-subunit alcohol dehydrogenase family)